MKAIVYMEYGSPDVLQLKEVQQPIPKDNEVLIRVHAAAINSYDLHFLRADPFVVRLVGGMRRPKRQILGEDVAGRVEAVGRNAKRLQVGDAVFGDICECGSGGFAEYVCAREDALALKPDSISFEEAAALPMAAVTALNGLQRVGQIKAGQDVLIHGASGGVGTFAVQMARVFGAKVTAVCSTRNVKQARALGADRVIDYTQDDFAIDPQRYDLILAANGDRSLLEYRRALKPGGIYVMAGGTSKQIFQAMLLGPLVSLAGSKKLHALASRPNLEDLNVVKEFVESGKIKPVIDRWYPLRETADAFRYIEDTHAQGKIIVTVPHE